MAAHENVNLKAPGSTPAEHPHRFLMTEAMMSQCVLELPTLVLNRQWQPVHVTTVARSLILLWNDRGAGCRSRRVPVVVVERMGRASADRRRALHSLGTAAAAGS